MKTIFTLLLFVATCSSVNCQTWQWVKSAGGTYNDEGNSVVSDKDGNIYVAASFYGSLSIGDSAINGNAVIKYSSTGDLLWAKRVNGVISDLATDRDGNIYLAGGFSGNVAFDTSKLINAGEEDIFVAKMSPLGHFIWAKSAGGTSNDHAFSVVVDSSDNVYITGLVLRSTMFDQINVPMVAGGVFLAKYKGSTGKVIWAKGKGENATGYHLTVDKFANIYMTGSFSFGCDFGTGTTFVSRGNTDVFVAKFDSSGVFNWVKQAGGKSYDVGNSIASEPDGNIYITGYFRDTSFFETTKLISESWDDIFVAKYNTSGDLVWAKREGGADMDIGFGIALGKSNDVYITGYWGIDYPSATYVTLIKYDKAGNQKFIKKIDNLGANLGKAVITDKAGDVYVTGGFYGTAVFNNTSATSIGGSDFFIAKYHPSISDGISILKKDDNISVYPNPCDNSLNISIPNLGGVLNVNISLLNMLGQMVHFETRKVQPTSNYTIDVTELSSGVYFLNINLGENMIIKKVYILK